MEFVILPKLAMKTPVLTLKFVSLLVNTILNVNARKDSDEKMMALVLISMNVKPTIILALKILDVSTAMVAMNAVAIKDTI